MFVLIRSYTAYLQAQAFSNDGHDSPRQNTTLVE